MLISQNRDEIRRFYLECWRKAREGLPMEAMEQLVADVVAEHPEYHGVLENLERSLGREYLPEMGDTNPFLHMGLHIAIREQVAVNRPHGIRPIHRRLSRALGSAMEAEHAMMDHLGEALWQAQRTGQAPDETAYLQALKAMEARLGKR